MSDAQELSLVEALGASPAEREETARLVEERNTLDVELLQQLVELAQAVDARAVCERASTEERERRADRRARIGTMCLVVGVIVGAVGAVAAVIAVL